MDLHVIGPLASPAERAAVDAVLGPAESAWRGGERNPMVEGHSARGGHEARSRRDLLFPALHAVQSRIGWISQPALNYISRRLTVPPADAYGVATFYALFSTTPRPPTVAHVCDDIACRLAGAEDVAADLERSLGPAGSPSADGSSTWLRSPCLGLCERAPAAMLTVAGPQPRTFVAGPVDAAGVVGRLSGAIAPDANNGIGGEQDKSAAIATGVPQAGQPGLRLLARVGVVDPTSLDAYRASGGFGALERARRIGPQHVIDEVTRSGSSAGERPCFGRKWAASRRRPPSPTTSSAMPTSQIQGPSGPRAHGHDPFAVVEAMAIEAFAVRRGQGVPVRPRRIPFRKADRERRSAIRSQPGSSATSTSSCGVAPVPICGEETALFESIEGKRGGPATNRRSRSKSGCSGKPTG
jgi:NADH-quinone oxidoreductase subunit F